MVSTAHPAFAVEQVGFFQDEKDLFEHFRGQALGGRKFLNLGNSLGRPAGHGSKGTERILGAFGKSHHASVIPQPGMAESGKPRWSPGHIAACLPGARPVGPRFLFRTAWFCRGRQRPIIGKLAIGVDGF